MTLLQHLTQQIKTKTQHQSGQEVAPLCILWPDKNKEWQEFLPLFTELSVLTFGDFDPDQNRGPAPYVLWRLYHGDRTAPPVIYLPGVGIDDLKASDTCPLELQPIAALRYQGALFAHPNGKDWTLASWFTSEHGAGLELEDKDSARLLLRSSFRQLLARDRQELSGTFWTSENLTETSVSDPVLLALHWLGSQGDKSAVPSENWAAFCQKAKKDYEFNPEKHSALEVANRLLAGEPKLNALWTRFLETPHRHPKLLELLEKIPLPKNSGDFLIPPDLSRYPLWFRTRHEQLSQALRILGAQTNQTLLVQEINKLWKDYQDLSETLWADLSWGPLLEVLDDLQGLAKAYNDLPLGQDWPSIIEWYSTQGNKTDHLCLRIMGWKKDLNTRPAILSIVQNLYLSWLESLNRIVEKAYFEDPHFLGRQPLGSSLPYSHQEVVFFVDALRYDLGLVLRDRILKLGLSVELHTGTTVLPTTTATAKAAVSPLFPDLTGGDLTTDDAYPLIDGKPCDADTLRKGLSQRAWTVLKPDSLSVADHGWIENSEIDTRGHEGSLPDQWSQLVDNLVHWVQRLIDIGWKQVRIVTDHGWLLVPHEFPRTALPPVLVSSKGGRAAIMKPNSQFPNVAVPWFWDPVQNYNLAPGVSTFYKSSFAHGGLSL